ncbi:unnamed protein product, partial [Ectocarpus sp. 12 AP-2014]
AALSLRLRHALRLQGHLQGRPGVLHSQQTCGRPADGQMEEARVRAALQHLRHQHQELQVRYRQHLQGAKAVSVGWDRGRGCEHRLPGVCHRGRGEQEHLRQQVWPVPGRYPGREAKAEGSQGPRAAFRC